MNYDIEGREYEAEDDEEKSENSEKKSSKLPDHFEDTYSLKPNEKYEVNGYKYKTDSHGRIRQCEGMLQLEEGKRNNSQQLHAGKDDRKESDEGGHLIAKRFGGSERIDNIVPMDKKLNHGEYKKLENTWNNYLSEKDENGESAGNEVEVKIRCIYPKDSERPEEFRVSWTVRDKNGEVIESSNRRFKNG